MLPEFRVWTGEKMEYNIVAGFFGAFYVNPMAKGDGLDENDSASLTPFNTRYSPETPLMQYIGLPDRNGIKIFEGDIVRVGYFEDGEGEVPDWTDDSVHQVKYFGNQDYPAFELEPNLGSDANGFADIFQGGEMSIEVIGNIYESPELLQAA